MFDLKKMGLDVEPIAEVFKKILNELSRIANALEYIAYPVSDAKPESPRLQNTDKEEP